MRKSRQMMVQRLVTACAAALLASTAPGGEDSSSLRRGADGFGDVRSAAFFARDGTMDEGRTFIAELRARPSEGRSTEELQSVDMAEFALLRKDVEHNRARAVECLRAVFDSCPTSFWGWAAYTFLKDMGETVVEPPRDPLRGLGSLADGVVNLEPRLLEPGTGNRESAGPVPHVACPEKFSLVDLKPGSSTRRAILRHRLIEICGEKKSLSLAKVLVYGKRLF